jgi:hypothetical protein
MYHPITREVVPAFEKVLRQFAHARGLVDLVHVAELVRPDEAEGLGEGDGGFSGDVGDAVGDDLVADFGPDEVVGDGRVAEGGELLDGGEDEVGEWAAFLVFGIDFVDSVGRC